MSLSFFKRFPSLTLTLYDFTLKGSAPFKKDTLVAAGEIALGVNIKSLVFNNRVDINKIFISDAFMNVQVNEKGEANYNVYINNKKKPQAIPVLPARRYAWKKSLLKTATWCITTGQ